MATYPERCPDGFIFHGGRTGSTLLVRMLKALKDIEVFSEIDLITQALNEKNDFSPTELRKIIKNTMNAYMSQIDLEKKCIFKFTSTDALEISLLMKYYPNVPVIYLFDSPERIISSQLLRPPRWIFQSISLAKKNGYKGNSLEKGSILAERIKAQSYLLNKAFKIILRHKHRTTLMSVSYEDLFSARLKKLFRHLGIKVTKEDAQKIAKVKLQDAKNPSKKFSKEKREWSTPRILSQHFHLPKSLELNYKKLKEISK